MNAEIIAVGTELLMGQIANTNAQYISEKLNSIGINVYYHSVVGDNRERLTETLSHACSRSQLVILTGGLGPTQDDLTKETVALFFERNLLLHEESLQQIKDYFLRINRTMVQSNEKQAYLPEGSIAIPNPNGTAPGCIIDNGKNIVALLPGPPREMQPMLTETILPYLTQKSDQKISSQYLRVFGIGESMVEDMLIDLIEGQTNPTIATYAKEFEVNIRITASCFPQQDVDSILLPVVSEIQKRLGNNITTTENEEMEFIVARLLQQSRQTLATAESCTGGLLSGRLTNVPGISESFVSGFVTYSNQAKVNNLGVQTDTLSNYGAVSEETAVEMARGVRLKSNADIGLSITGIAGPGGATDIKPVGLVYIALAHQEGTICKKLTLQGNRQRIRHAACLHALNLIRLHLLQL